jgi:hypothetical protein
LVGRRVVRALFFFVSFYPCVLLDGALSLTEFPQAERQCEKRFVARRSN